MPSIVAWTDDLLKIRLQQELRDYGSFGHGEVHIRIYHMGMAVNEAVQVTISFSNVVEV